MSADNAGPAFPSLDLWDVEKQVFTAKGSQGMTLRDHFAGLSLQGMTANPELMQVVTADAFTNGDALAALAKKAYQQADAMLIERAK